MSKHTELIERVMNVPCYTEEDAKALAAIADALEAQTREIEGLRKDAERYRWLRNKSTVLHNTAWLGGATAVQRDVNFLRRDDALAALDAAIDAARKQGGK